MNENRIRKDERLSQLPPEWPVDLLPQIRESIHKSGQKVVVLDDDPTGTQTVHGVPVLTGWAVPDLIQELASGDPAVYLLTNSRSLPAEEAQTLNHEIGTRLRQAQTAAGRELTLISRSNSTLRGHFPSEVSALEKGFQENFSAWLIVPFFPEGGRFTIDDIHYVADGEWLVPAGQTEFAGDKVFGYRSSNLREWAAEKTNGAVSAAEVASISIEDLRQGGPQMAAERLLALPQGAFCVVNAASYRDLEVLVMGLLKAEAQGRRYLHRTAASFVRVRAGIAPRPLLSLSDLNLPQNGAGLIIAGSYVPRTSSQIEALLAQSLVERVELHVPHLLNESTRAGEIQSACRAVNFFLAQGKDTIIFTSRELISAEKNDAQIQPTETARANLAIGQAVSDALVSIVHGLEVRPRYLLAKGGITSSDIATQGLGIQRAWVPGQVLPGVPVWQTGPESRFPDLTYIVFPGNVGGPDALVQVVNQLKA